MTHSGVHATPRRSSPYLRISLHSGQGTVERTVPAQGTKGGADRSLWAVGTRGQEGNGHGGSASTWGPGDGTMRGSAPKPQNPKTPKPLNRFIKFSITLI